MQEHDKPRENGRVIRIRVPQLPPFSLQTVILLLLVAVAGLQTAQILGLKSSLAKARIGAPAAAAASAAPSSDASLPEMVGGC